MSDPFRLDGRVALVTGGTRGIGLAIARLLLTRGARVAISSEIAAEVAQVAAMLGDGAHGLVCDAADPEACRRLADDAAVWGGGLDILVCNAGITGAPGPTASVDIAQFDRVIAVNLRGAVALAGAALPLIARRPGGSVVLIASIAASRGNAAINAYALAKAGIVQLARNLAVEWGPRGVRVNSVSPGLIRTGFSMPLLDDADFMERRMQMTPLRRPGEAEEVASAVIFLASAAAGFVTGHDLVVDGGTLVTDGS